MKIAYICHPIGGNVEQNITNILEIIERINLEEMDVVPFAPYLGDVQALNDNDPEMRKRGIKNDHEIIERDFIDECRVYGDKISQGMRNELFRFWDLDIEVTLMVKTRHMEEELDRVDSEYNAFLIKRAKDNVVKRLLEEEKDEDQCTECLKSCLQEELDMFGGLCEDCHQEPES